eukprot:3407858-Rhodomonas_salina.1
MQQPREVGFVKLHARSDSSTARMDQFEIRLGDSTGELDNPVCHSPNQNANTVTWVNWAVCKGVGRYLFLLWYPTTDTLVDVCEVEIFAPITLSDVAPPFRWYHAKNWQTGSRTLKDIGSSAQDTVSQSRVGWAKAAGNAARQPVDYIYGDTSSSLTWDTFTVPTEFTICSVTRWTSADTARQRRILNGGNRNWLHGHYQDPGTGFPAAVGGAFYSRPQGNWNSYNEGGLGPRTKTDWWVQCGKNAGPDTATSLLGAGTNFITYGRFNGDHNLGLGDVTLQINAGQTMPGQESDWALHQVVIWDYHLSEAQFVAASDILHIGLEECGCTILDAAFCTAPGYFFNTTACDCSCTQCPAGTYLNATRGCEACPANTSSPPGSPNITHCGCPYNFEGSGSLCTACPPGKFKGNIGDGACSDIDECATSASLTVSPDNPAGFPAWSNVPAALDGLTSTSLWQTQPNTDRFDCADIAYMIFDVGEVVKFTSVTYYMFSNRQYCSQRVEVSMTGAFAGEETRVFGCGDYADCGIVPSTGRVVTFSVPGQYMRVGSSRDGGTGIHMLEVVPTYTPLHSCASAGECVNTDGSFNCIPISCPNNTVSPRTVTDISDCECAVGYTGPGGTACSACEAGTFKAVNGSAQCT